MSRAEPLQEQVRVGCRVDRADSLHRLGRLIYEVGLTLARACEPFGGSHIISLALRIMLYEMGTEQYVSGFDGQDSNVDRTAHSSITK